MTNDTQTSYSTLMHFVKEYRTVTSAHASMNYHLKIGFSPDKNMITHDSEMQGPSKSINVTHLEINNYDYS